MVKRNEAANRPKIDIAKPLLPGGSDAPTETDTVGVVLREYGTSYISPTDISANEFKATLARVIQENNAIGEKLGLQCRIKMDADLVILVEDQLPVTVISALQQHGVTEKEIYSVVVPRRTLQHRRARKEKLSREESDRAVRLARLVSLTEKVFGDWDEGMRWLRAPKKRFRGRTPMDMISTETGGRLVEEVLYQVDEGMAA